MKTLPEVALTSRRVRAQHALDDLLAAAKGHDLVVIGARPLRAGAVSRSFGEPHDRIIRDAQTDVLVVVSTDDDLSCPAVSRILVPVNGLAHSLSAGDVAAYLAHGSDAELVLFQVVRPLPVASKERTGKRDGEQGPSREADMGIRVTHCVRTGDDPGGAILHELARERYGLVVLGGYDRGDGSADLGATIPTVVAQD